MPNEFQNLLDEYYKLRGRFATGRITADEFDHALHDLVVEDEQGRPWMIGANTGRWYMYQGSQWVESEPPVLVHHSEPPAHAHDAALVSAPGARSLPLGPAFIGVVSMLILGVVFTVFANRTELFATGPVPPTPTRLVAATSVAVAALPSATVTLFATSTSTALTPIPVTVAPTIGLTLQPTNVTTPITIPTVTPFPIPTRAATVPSKPDSGQVNAFPSKPDSGQVNAFPSNPDSGQVNTFPVAVAQGVYITALTLAPGQPKRRQPVIYTANFLNTTGQTVYFKWKIVVFDPNKNGRNKDWGESQVTGLTVPPGASTASISYVTVSNGGGCIPLQATAGWRRDDNARILFPSQAGGPIIVNFQVC